MRSCVILSAFSLDPLNSPASSEQALKYVYAGGVYEVRMQGPSWLHGGRSLSETVASN